MEHYVRRSIINAPSKEVFLWHLREGTFERLNPPWQPFTIIEKREELKMVVWSLLI
jgi:ligand-binding SRPBCC domain-containing protein